MTARQEDCRFYLYYEDLELIAEQVPEADRFSIVLALSRLAQFGEELDRHSVSPLAFMAYSMIRQKVIKDKEHWRYICEVNSHKGKGSEAELSTDSANADERGRTGQNRTECDMSMSVSGVGVRAESKPASEAEQDEYTKTASKLMVEYDDLKNGQETLAALADALKNFTYQEVRSALDKARTSNKGGKIPVGYWRPILNGIHQTTGKADAFMQRSHNPKDFEGIEVDLDAPLPEEKPKAQPSASPDDDGLPF